MENSVSADDSIEKADNRPVGVSGAASPSVAIHPSGRAAEDSADQAEKHQERSLTELSDINLRLNPQKSMQIHLEPPPVIKRPPKIKNDNFSLSFNYHTYSLFSWSRTEQKEVLHCARSTSHSYEFQTTLRLLGFNISKKLVFKTSESGIDTAVQQVRMGWGNTEKSWVNDRLPKLQSIFEKHSGKQPNDAANANPDGSGEQGVHGDANGPDIERQKNSGRSVHPTTYPWLHDHYYVVVGFMGDESVPKETLRRVMHKEGLFQQIRKANRQLRNPIRRMLSLKEVSGFSIYECDPIRGYHREADVDGETKRALAEMWRSYKGHKLDYEGRWLMWIHEHFNNNSKKPEMGRLTLEFKLRWSVSKVVFWGIIPVLLSLAIGFYYMYADHPGVDDVAVAEAAWVIATYIVTSSALLLALLAVITQFGDV